MPQIWNNMVVVTKDELIPAFFPSLGALQKRLPVIQESLLAFDEFREVVVQIQKYLLILIPFPKNGVIN